MPFDNYSESDFKAFAQEMNHPRINIEKFAERLRRAANAADKVRAAYEVIREAKARNPRGLIF